MTRWLIWSQVGFAGIGFVATLADRGVVSHSCFPPQAVLTLCAWSAFIVPAIVLRSRCHRREGSGQTFAAIASVGLGFVTLFALLPLVQ